MAANKPNDEQRHTAEEPAPAKRRGREISGPGAGDFLASQGGVDLPGSDADKGTGTIRGEGLVDRERLFPALDEPDPSAEREVLTPDSPRSRKTPNDSTS
jgi:hypothetical protein